MARVQLTLLHSRVARRVAGLFILCGLLPIALLAGVSTWMIHRYLRAEEESRLRWLAKDSAMQSVGRLIEIEARLRLVAVQPALRLSGSTVPGILGLARLDSSGQVTPMVGLVNLPALDAQARHRLDQGDSVLLPPVRPSGPMYLIVPTPGAPVAHRRLVAALDARSIWSLDDRTSEGQITREICGVIGAGLVLACADGALPAAEVSLATRDGGAATFTTRVNGIEWMGATWTAPLTAHFFVSRWTAAVFTRTDDALAPARAATRTFGLAVVATLCVVLLVSFQQIRRQLDPIDRLRAGTTRLAEGDFESRVIVETGDEFEDLGKAFNAMAGELREQFVQLRELSVGTLEALARAIDAKSPWTAGHSTRVTAIAVAIGAAMGLDERELEIVRRGGLLHDLGKIGIPASILDKAGPLTPAEISVMQEHPAVGARILEPLPHCADILPIVLQHHERLDGGGYPAGLRGDAINPLARVLAVADVYDAMTNERPYRKALLPVDVAAHIAAGAGTHFDPVVVDALLVVLAAEGLPVAHMDRRLVKSA